MSLYKKVLEEKAALHLKISTLEERIKAAPEGTLLCYKNGTRTKWLQKIPGKEGNGHTVRRFIPQKKRGLAEALAQKTCDKYDLLDARQELKAHNAYLKIHEEKPSRKANALTQRDRIRELLHPGQSPCDELRAWQEASYPKNTRYPEHLTVKTVRGEYVRSKSESLIALVLTNHNIPYRYECAIEIEGNTFHPDFTILHPVTREIILWEHFGRIDDEQYFRSDFVYKLVRYIRSGFIPDKNLIMTFESDEHPLDVQLADTLARHYLC